MKAIKRIAAFVVVVAILLFVAAALWAAPAAPSPWQRLANGTVRLLNSAKTVIFSITSTGGVAVPGPVTINTAGSISVTGTTMTLDDGDGAPISLNDIRTAAAGGDAAAIHDNTAGEILAITEKTTPVDADALLIEDTQAANVKKSLTWASLKATLKTYLDTLYLGLGGGTTTGAIVVQHAGGLQVGKAGEIQGDVRFFSNTAGNNYYFDIFGANYAANLGWRLPAAAPTTNNSGVLAATDGTLTYAPFATQAEMEAGTETGPRVVSPQRVAQAIAALSPTAASLHVDDLITLSGVASGSANLGAFTGSTISDNQTIKAALQALETALELKQASHAILTAISNLSLAQGDILGATGSNTPTRIAKGSPLYLFRMNAAGTSQEWIDGATVFQPLDADLTALAAISGQRGDIIYYGASGWTRLAKGTPGYVLTEGANDPAWAASTGSGDLKADGTVPLTADWDLGNFDIEVGSVTIKKASGVAGQSLRYSSNSTDVTGWINQGPTGTLANSIIEIDPLAEPSANQFKMAGTPTNHIFTDAWQTYGLPISAGATDLGSASAEWGDVFLKDAAHIYGQADQSAIFTSSAGKWSANSFGVTTAFDVTGTAEIGDAGDDVNLNLNVNATDGHWSGVTITRTVKTGSAAEAFGQPMFINSSGELEAADADVADAAAMPAVCILVTAGEGASKKCVISGTVTETDWNWTPGAILYVSTAPATTTGLTATRPATTGNFIQRVGVALSADTILVMPSLDVGTAP